MIFSHPENSLDIAVEDGDPMNLASWSSASVIWVGSRSVDPGSGSHGIAQLCPRQSDLNRRALTEWLRSTPSHDPP